MNVPVLAESVMILMQHSLKEDALNPSWLRIQADIYYGKIHILLYIYIYIYMNFLDEALLVFDFLFPSTIKSNRYKMKEKLLKN